MNLPPESFRPEAPARAVHPRPDSASPVYRLLPCVPGACLGAWADALLGLWQRNLSIQEPRRLRWFYADHPGGRAATWIAVTGSGAAVGCASLLPLGPVVAGETYRAAMTIDFAVDREHRVYGPARRLLQAAVSSAAPLGFDVLLAAPTREARGLFLIHGFRPLGELTQWIKPLHFGPWLGRRLPHGLAEVLGSGLDAFTGTWERIRFRKAAHWPADLVVQNGAGAEFADWTSRRKTECLGPRKNAAWLQWRYADSPTQPHRFFCLRDRGDGRLLAWAAIARLARSAVISDLQAVHPGLRRILLIRCLERLRQANVPLVSLSVLGNARWTSLLNSLHFIQRGPGRECLIRVEPSVPAADAERLTNPAHWCLFEGDLDL